MSEIVVRDAGVEDADEIARVHVGTWQSAYRGLMPGEFLDGLSIEQRAQGWRQALTDGDPYLPDQKIWVAESNRRIAGFCTVGPSRDGDATESTGELYAIYVDAGQWDTGVGVALVRRALKELSARFTEATLWVLDSNDRGRRFYEKGGWRPDGATKDDDRGSFVLHEVRYRIDL